MSNDELLEKIVKKNVADKANQILRVLKIGFSLVLISIAVVISLQLKTIKKVHFRYFNLTHSLEEIHNVEIDTHHGDVIKRY